MKAYIHIFIFILFSTGFAWTISSCKSSDPEPSKTELLTQSWKLVAVKVNGADQPMSGYSLKFSNSGSYTSSGALLSIPPSGTWAFNSSETIINLDGGPMEIRVVKLESDEMVLEFTQSNYKNGDVIIRMEFEKS